VLRIAIALGGAAALACAFAVSNAAAPASGTRCVEDVVINGDNVDANYKNGKIQLRNVVISQCDIRVQAKSATANGLNIDSARWTFDGDVHIDVENRGNLRANQAEVEFRDSQIAKLIITGTPAEFEQQRKDADGMARGHAKEIIYDVTAGTVHLSSDAWLNYGRSDLKCEQILYDIRQQAAQCPKQDGERVQLTIPAKPHAPEAKPAAGQPATAPVLPAPGPAPKAP
jgi:lipopolysaccharide transport protein LptA